MTPEQQKEMVNLGINASTSLDLILKLLQILVLMREINGDEAMTVLAKKFDPLIADILGHMDEGMKAFVRKYGEN
jgi:hypothetical protein